MIVRLGYVAISLNLPKVTSSSNITFKNYAKINLGEKLNKLKKITLSNTVDLYKIIQYNIKNQIHFYRITSALIPLATHPEVTDWNYRKIFKVELERIGELVKEHGLRVDTHPDQFNVINSTEPQIVENTKRNLLVHGQLFEDMNYEPGKMVIHIGSGQGGKEAAISRFLENIEKFPPEITNRLILENDDKIFNANDLLYICKKLHKPMVLDLHHFMCNNDGETLESILPDVFDTWNPENLSPKVHFSSPKGGLKDRKHADYIDANDFVEFIEQSKFINRDFDVMIEAKKKDLALFKLVNDIKNLKSNWKWIDKTTFEV